MPHLVNVFLMAGEEGMDGTMNQYDLYAFGGSIGKKLVEGGHSSGVNDEGGVDREGERVDIPLFVVFGEALNGGSLVFE